MRTYGSHRIQCLKEKLYVTKQLTSKGIFVVVDLSQVHHVNNTSIFAIIIDVSVNYSQNKGEKNAKYQFNSAAVCDEFRCKL